jgi:hypothetical protein
MTNYDEYDTKIAKPSFSLNFETINHLDKILNTFYGLNYQPSFSCCLT